MTVALGHEEVTGEFDKEGLTYRRKNSIIREIGKNSKKKNGQCWKPGGKCIGQRRPHTAAQQTNYGV